MQILLLRHYPLSEGPSMRAFADQIASGLRSRGHIVRELTAPVLFSSLALRNPSLAKWLGYIDQFVVFPPLLWWRAQTLPLGTLCVFADQALGLWIPLLSHRPHLVHVHDLLAMDAALGNQPFHRLRSSGRCYQRWIRRGFRHALCFVSVSKATRSALVKQLQQRPKINEVLYNPLQSRFRPLPTAEAASAVMKAIPRLGSESFLFHVGRNWYKNRLGVLAIWEELQSNGKPIHLVLLGAASIEMEQWIQQHPVLIPRLHVLNQASDSLVLALYNRASALVFPSHAEGFGWPILEALACGCPVITTNRPPMSEVGGAAATYIPPYPLQPSERSEWASIAAEQVRSVLERTPHERQHARKLGLLQAQSFECDRWLDRLECHYQHALSLQESG